MAYSYADGVSREFNVKVIPATWDFGKGGSKVERENLLRDSLNAKGEG